jgi:2',3'-cyclic-nucleotide 2'-phosphodiesterase (5'-nucleotidase family)
MYDMAQGQGAQGGLFNMMFGGHSHGKKKQQNQKPKVQPTKRAL